jgi:hypothetical protein
MMVPDPAAPDWRPFRATAAALLAALALNLWTRNALWASYTLIGLGLWATVAGLVRWTAWRPHPRAVWLVGLTLALHYGGGSLSGLHQVGGPNGLYAAFPWWDNVVHFLGSGAVAMAAYTALEPLLRRRALAAFLAICVATLAGVLVELYEFFQFYFLGTVDQGYYTNNMLDLYNNLVGATLAACLMARLAVLDSRKAASSMVPAQDEAAS